ncbi:UNVERIFIED_CONTAM: hypothetical protein K2H54_041425 [Gekko kuhli]
MEGNRKRGIRKMALIVSASSFAFESTHACCPCKENHTERATKMWGNNHCAQWGFIPAQTQHFPKIESWFVRDENGTVYFLHQNVRLVGLKLGAQRLTMAFEQGGGGIQTRKGVRPSTLTGAGSARKVIQNLSLAE